MGRRPAREPVPRPRGQGAGAARRADSTSPTEDVRAVAHPVLRHRIITTFGAEAEGYTSDRLIDDLLEGDPGDGERGPA